MREKVKLLESFNSKDGAIDSGLLICKFAYPCNVSIPKMVRLIEESVSP